jgi:hypothetical protein
MKALVWHGKQDIGFPRGAAKARGAAEGFTPVDFQVTATEERTAEALEPA